jgi:hypothetical protein
LAPEETGLILLRDVLYAKAAAFERTGERLTTREYLEVYRYRTQIKCGLSEFRLLLASRESNPVHYFLKTMGEDARLKCLYDMHPSLAEETDGSEQLCHLMSTLRRYNKWERRYPVHVPERSLQDVKGIIAASRCDEDERGEAAIEAALALPAADQNALMEKLLRSRTRKDTRLVFALGAWGLCFTGTSAEVADIEATRSRTRVLAYCKLAVGSDSSWVSRVRARVIDGRRIGDRERSVAAFALAYWAQEANDAGVLRELLNAGMIVRSAALSALHNNRGGLSLDEVLQHYESCPSETAAAVRRSFRRSEWSKVARLVKGRKLSPAVRSLIIALCTIREMNMFPWLMELIAEAGYKIELGELWGIEREMCRLVTRSLKDSLVAREVAEAVVNAQYFWEYPAWDEVPVEDFDNVYIYKRLAGVVFAAVCGRPDWHLLKRLVFHSYFPVRAAAIAKVLEFSGEEELNELIPFAIANLERSASRKSALAATDVLTALDGKLYSDW